MQRQRVSLNHLLLGGEGLEGRKDESEEVLYEVKCTSTAAADQAALGGVVAEGRLSTAFFGPAIQHPKIAPNLASNFENLSREK